MDMRRLSPPDEGGGERPCRMTAEKLAGIITMVSEGRLTRANGRQVLEALFFAEGDPANTRRKRRPQDR